MGDALQLSTVTLLCAFPGKAVALDTWKTLSVCFMEIGNEEKSQWGSPAPCTPMVTVVMVTATGCSGMMFLLSPGESVGSGVLENGVPGSAMCQELPPETCGYTDPIPNPFPVGFRIPRVFRQDFLLLPGVNAPPVRVYSITLGKAAATEMLWLRSCIDSQVLLVATVAEALQISF